MPRSSVKPHALRFLYLLCVVALVLTSCAEDDRRGIRLTPTSTVETGVRVLADNCPGPSTVSLNVRDEVLWQIDNATQPAPVDDELTDDEAPVPDGLVQPPGIVEFLIGQTPEGWTTTTELSQPLQPGIRYTIVTEPDGQSIDFSTPDLAAGLLWDGQGNARFNADLIGVECSAPADIGGFVRSLGVLTLLGVTASALVLVALILLLFVITRRFNRVKSLQQKAQQSNGPAPRDAQRPRVRTKS